MTGRRDLIEYARETAEQYGIPAEIFLGLIETESGFNPDAIGPELPGGVRAIGIAQFMPSTARLLGIDPWDPFDAIDGAGRYLSGLYKITHDWRESVARYKGFRDVRGSRARSAFSKVIDRGKRILEGAFSIISRNPVFVASEIPQSLAGVIAAEIGERQTRIASFVIGVVLFVVLLYVAVSRGI